MTGRDDNDLTPRGRRILDGLDGRIDALKREEEALLRLADRVVALDAGAETRTTENSRARRGGPVP